MSSSRFLFSGQLFAQGSVWLPGWICLMEMVPSASDVSHWQWLGWAPVTPANVQSIASVSSGAHREQNPHGVCLHLLFSTYRTNAWEFLGMSGLSAYGRTAALPFCMLTVVLCLFRYIYYARSKANSTWHFLCLIGYWVLCLAYVHLEPYLHLKGLWRYQVISVILVWDMLCSNWNILYKRPSYWVV